MGPLICTRGIGRCMEGKSDGGIGKWGDRV